MLKYLYYVILLFIAASCISNKKTIYIQDPRVTTKDTVSVPFEYKDYKIHPRDMLNIRVVGLDPKTTVFFNADYGTSGNNPITMGSPQAAYMTAYIVDDSGYVYMPILGSIYVKGLTVQEIQKKVEALVNEHVETASVFVKIVNFKITVLGDVNHPGLFYMYNPRMSIFEVLAQAGDLNAVANRTRVKLIRMEEGRAEIIYLNVLDPKVISSKYFFIKPNDILYVENYKVKPFKANTSTFTFVVGLVTTFFVIYTFINTIKK